MESLPKDNNKTIKMKTYTVKLPLPKEEEFLVEEIIKTENLKSQHMTEMKILQEKINMLKEIRNKLK